MFKEINEKCPNIEAFSVANCDINKIEAPTDGLKFENLVVLDLLHFFRNIKILGNHEKKRS